jgi:pilus assembly protein CpaB
MLILAIVSLGLSVFVAFVGYRVLQSRLSPTEDNARIVVAAEKLSLGTRLTEKHLDTVPWPSGAPMEGSFTDPKQIVGRGVVIPMALNEPVLESKLAPKEAGAGLAAAIPEGLRAVAVKVNEVIGVAGFVLPESRVDVILTGSPTASRTTDTSKVILENVQVLAAGSSLEQDADGTPKDVPVVTLLVTPEGAEKLALASASGRIQLALRYPLDLEHQDPVAVKRAELFRGSTTPEPSSTKPTIRRVRRPPITVELIQGDERQTVTFERTRQ